MELLLKYKYLFLALILSLISVIPLLHSGLPPTHDGEYNVIRFYEFDRAIQGGDWYPRWAQDLNFGYGVPIFNFIYPFPSMVAFFLHLFGVSLIDAFKLNMIFASFLGTVFFYLWTKRYWGEAGGFVSSIFYTYAPYHFLDIYIRGSAAEVWALAFFPAFLWSLDMLLESNKLRYIGFSSIFLGFIIFSHNILALMFFLFVVSYMLLQVFLHKNKKILPLYYISVLILSLGMSAIFWLPALVEKKYTVGLELYSFKAHFPELYELLIPSWGSGFSGAGLEGKMSFQVGIANILGILLAVFTTPFFKKDRRIFYSIIFFLVWFFIVFFLMLKTSIPVWDKIPLMEYFQYPWRFLSLEILTSSFLAGSVFLMVNQRKKFIKSIVVIILGSLAVFLTFNYAKIPYYLEREDSYYTTRSNFIDGTNYTANTFNTKWAHGIGERRSNKIEFISGNGAIENLVLKNSQYIFTAKIKDNHDILRVNTVYFPGWVVVVDGRETPISINQQGSMEFSVVKGEHSVAVELRETGAQAVGKILTFISIGIICLLLLSRKKLPVRIRL